MVRTTVRVLAIAGSLVLSASPVFAQARGTMNESGRPLPLAPVSG